MSDSVFYICRGGQATRTLFFLLFYFSISNGLVFVVIRFELTAWDAHNLLSMVVRARQAVYACLLFRIYISPTRIWTHTLDDVLYTNKNNSKSAGRCCIRKTQQTEKWLNLCCVCCDFCIGSIANGFCRVWRNSKSLGLRFCFQIRSTLASLCEAYEARSISHTRRI